MVRAVLFDAAGTLLHVYPSVGAIYADEAVRHGVRVSSNTVGRSFASVWRARRPYADGRTPFHTSEAVERAWWRGLVEHVFIEACGGDAFGERFDEFFDALYLRFARSEVWRIFDDVIPTLDALRERRVPVAVVSNWDSRLPRLLEAMGFADRFEFTLTSAEAGIGKPAPEIFHLAVNRLHLVPANVLHVGDSLDDDVTGAQRAGLQSVQIVRGGARPGKVGTIASLLSVLEMLGEP